MGNIIRKKCRNKYIKRVLVVVITLIVLLLLFMPAPRGKFRIGKLIGPWNIYEYESIYDFEIIFLPIQIFEDGSLEIPAPLHKDKEIVDNGTWYVTKTDDGYSLTFNVPNNPFNGTYNIRYFMDHNILENRTYYKMELSNDTNTIICYKDWALSRPQYFENNWEDF